MSEWSQRPFAVRKRNSDRLAAYYAATRQLIARHQAEWDELYRAERKARGLEMLRRGMTGR